MLILNILGIIAISLCLATALWEYKLITVIAWLTALM